MKRAVITTLIVFLLSGIGAISIRSLLRRQTSKTAQAKPATQPIVDKTNIVSYGGVSFTFDPSLASGVKPETIPAVAEERLTDTTPEHPSFGFIDYQAREGLCCNEPEIRVFPVDKFREMVRPANQEDAKSVAYNAVDEEVRVLRLLLAGKPSQANVGTFLGKVRGEKGCGEMPFLPIFEACMAFTARHSYLSFKNGKGIFFLTQWDKETTQINNGWLEYSFQGITDDGRYYVSAEFPVAAPFLPKGDEPVVSRADYE